MKYLYLFFIILLFTNCKTTRQSAGTEYTVVQFGSGGGITNNITTYSLYPDGQLWMKKSIEKDSSLISTISRRQVKKTFTKVKASGADTLRYQNPGNYYYFIQTRKPSEQNIIEWSDDNPPDKNIEDLYKYLIEKIK